MRQNTAHTTSAHQPCNVLAVCIQTLTLNIYTLKECNAVQCDHQKERSHSQACTDAMSHYIARPYDRDLKDHNPKHMPSLQAACCMHHHATTHVGTCHTACKGWQCSQQQPPQDPCCKLQLPMPYSAQPTESLLHWLQVGLATMGPAAATPAGAAAHTGVHWRQGAITHGYARSLHTNCAGHVDVAAAWSNLP
jgi:hypothetical protein